MSSTVPQRAGSRHEPAAGRIPADDHGGTCRAVIDLSVPAAEHSHRPQMLALGHIGSRPPHERQPVAFEFIQPAGFVDAHCPDCPSTVTLLAGAPPCVAGLLVVSHADTCPALARLRGRRS